MAAFIITTTEKQYLIFAYHEEHAKKKFQSKTNRKIISIEKVTDFENMYELVF